MLSKNTQITFFVKFRRIDTLIKDDYVSSQQSYYRLKSASFVLCTTKERQASTCDAEDTKKLIFYWIPAELHTCGMLVVVHFPFLAALQFKLLPFSHFSANAVANMLRIYCIICLFR